jgi:hypothetical protein
LTNFLTKHISIENDVLKKIGKYLNNLFSLFLIVLTEPFLANVSNQLKVLATYHGPFPCKIVNKTTKLSMCLISTFPELNTFYSIYKHRAICNNKSLLQRHITLSHLLPHRLFFDRPLNNSDNLLHIKLNIWDFTIFLNNVRLQIRGQSL